ANQWEFTAPESSEHGPFRSYLEEIELKLGEYGSALVFINAMSNDASARTNFGITRLDLVTDIVGVGMPVEIEAEIIHSGVGRETETVYLEYQIDSTGIRRFDKPINVAAGESVSVKQVIGRFAQAGAHRVMVRIARPNQDAFPDDNQAFLALNALSEVPVLLIDGEPASSDVRTGEIEVLSFAMEVSTSEDEQGNTLLRLTPNKVTAIQASGINAAVLKKAKVIVLANVATLTPSAIQLIEDRVSTGGASLWITLGDQVDKDAYNTRLWKKGSGLLPMQLGDPRSYRDGQGDDKVLELLRMVVKDTSETAPVDFSRPDIAALHAEVPGLARWFSGKLPQEFPEIVQAKGLPAKVHLAVGNQSSDPLLVTRPFGRGMVALWTSSIDEEWNEYWSLGDLPLLKISLEMVAYLSGIDSRGRSLMVGDRVVQDVPLLPSGYSMVAPKEGVSALPQTEIDKSTVRVIFGETYFPGVYILRPTDSEASSGDSTHYYSVAMPSLESDVRPLGGEENSAKGIADAFRKLLADYESIRFEEKELSSAEIAGSQGDREMDRWLLFIGLAMLCLLAEIGLATMIGRRKEA
ncbi:MAG: hypothetical protein KDB07_10310, partial [Planctomycetes bacterium]|nr:hypothetical protein [Planctomycetota bacterium]